MMLFPLLALSFVMLIEGKAFYETNAKRPDLIEGDVSEFFNLNKFLDFKRKYF